MAGKKIVIKEEKKNTKPFPHRLCVHAHLVQYANDPVIAECSIGGGKHVASAIVTCPEFVAGNCGERAQKQETRYY